MLRASAPIFIIMLFVSLLPEYKQLNLFGSALLNLLIPVYSGVVSQANARRTFVTGNSNLGSMLGDDNVHQTSRLNMVNNRASDMNYAPLFFVNNCTTPVFVYRISPKGLLRRFHRPIPKILQTTKVMPQTYYHEPIPLNPKPKYDPLNIARTFLSNEPNTVHDGLPRDVYTLTGHSPSLLAQPVPVISVSYDVHPLTFKPPTVYVYRAPDGTNVYFNNIDKFLSHFKINTQNNHVREIAMNLPKSNQKSPENVGIVKGLAGHAKGDNIFGKKLEMEPMKNSYNISGTELIQYPKDNVNDSAKHANTTGSIHHPVEPAYNVTKIVKYPTKHHRHRHHHHQNTINRTRIVKASPEHKKTCVDTEIQLADPKLVRKYYLDSLSNIERSFYKVTFEQLLEKNEDKRRENSISFVQSGLVLHFMLTLLSFLNKVAVEQNGTCNFFNLHDKVKINALRSIFYSLPSTDKYLKFRWSSRIVLPQDYHVPHYFRTRVAEFDVHIDHINKTDDAEFLTKTLNKMVEQDSGRAMRDTFDEEELAGGACGVLLSTVHLRAHWRRPPVLLNSTWTFRDAGDLAHSSTRMIRLIDVMGYARLRDWDAEALEIPYLTPGLTLVVMRPRRGTPRALAGRVAAEGLAPVLARLRPRRAAAVLPLYTLRMTVLLPEKLARMGFSSVLAKPGACGRGFSHAVQRVMFWSEAGRDAYKDDGIQWDEKPDVEVIMDRPYLFFVRWNNFTLMNGHFAL